MIDHVSARCAQFRLLFPTRNIESIVPLSTASLTPRWPLASTREHASARAGSDAHARTDAHDPSAPACQSQPALDLRRLLCQREPEPQPSCIRLEWVSTDSERRIPLIVDAVDEIVNSPHGHLERLPLLPRRLLTLCDGVYHNPDGTYRISVKLDVAWPMHSFAERKLWLRSLVSLTTDAPASAAPSNTL